MLKSVTLLTIGGPLAFRTGNPRAVGHGVFWRALPGTDDVPARQFWAGSSKWNDIADAQLFVLRAERNAEFLYAIRPGVHSRVCYVQREWRSFLQCARDFFAAASGCQDRCRRGEGQFKPVSRNDLVSGIGEGAQLILAPRTVLTLNQRPALPGGATLDSAGK